MLLGPVKVGGQLNKSEFASHVIISSKFLGLGNKVFQLRVSKGYGLV